MDVMQIEKDHNKILQDMERWLKFNAPLAGFFTLLLLLVDNMYSNTE